MTAPNILDQKKCDQGLVFERRFMSEQLYNDAILKLAAGLVAEDRLSDPDISVTVDSPLCGSRVKIDVKYSEETGLISGYGHEVRACALGQSSAAIVAKTAVGCSLEEISLAKKQLENMLKKEGPVPEGKWYEYEALLPARSHRSRHASILLPLKAVEKAITEVKDGREKSQVNG